MSKLVSAQLTYFGKIPARGDFVKVDHNHRLLSALDDWLTRTMEGLSADPRWKITYDGIKPQHFGLLGSRRKIAVAGHLVASHDQSGRRFPFVVSSALAIDQPLDFAARSPLALSRLWARSQALTQKLLHSDDKCVSVLDSIAAADINVEVDAAAYNAHFDDFLEIQSLGALQDRLQQSGHVANLQNILPALGLLLQPVLASGATRLDKGLVLPLPDDPIHRYPVAALWMDLITPFFSRAEIEVALFIGAVDNKAVLAIGAGPTPNKTLLAVLDPEVSARENIALANPEWVEPHIRTDYGLQKLAAYLAQPDVSLRRARDTFREVFLGG